MLKLEYSEALERVIRKDDWPELGISTWDRLRDAMKGDRKEEALKILDYLQHEGKYLHDLYCDWTYADMTYVAENYGEKHMYKMLRFVADKVRAAAQDKKLSITVEEMVQWWAESMRAHNTGPGETGTFTVREEEDRFVMSFDPCGSGGRMRRTGELDGTPPRTGPPYNFGRTKRAYPWSWGKKGVPYYCLHCAIWSEIMPIESRGYPLRVAEYSDDPEKPCTWYIYKRPELIPARYFEQLGMKKDLSRGPKGKKAARPKSRARIKPR